MLKVCLGASRQRREECAMSARHQRRRPREVSGLARRCAEQDCAHCRWPPASAAVGGLYAVGCQPAGDLAQASALCVLEPDPLDDGRGQHGRTSGPATCRCWSCPVAVLTQEPLELCNGDEPLTPGCLDGVDCRYDVPVDGRDAEAEGLRRL